MRQKNIYRVYVKSVQYLYLDVPADGMAEAEGIAAQAEISDFAYSDKLDFELGEWDVAPVECPTHEVDQVGERSKS